MKLSKFFITVLLLSCFSMELFGQVKKPQPAIKPITTTPEKKKAAAKSTNQIPISANAPIKEKNCFRNFRESFDGDSKINAYLLAYVTYLSYSERLAREVTGKVYTDENPYPQLNNSDLFREQFRKKMEPMFWDPSAPASSINVKPVIDFITNPIERLKRIGIDPEACVISTPKYIIIAWRGTDRVITKTDMNEWWGTDFKAPMISAPPITGRVHQGFWESMNCLAMQLSEFIVNQDPNHNKQIWITGHSLGGAVAELYTDYLVEQNFIPKSRIHCYTYAGPSFIGDSQFAAKINSFGNKIQRFEFQMDLVPIIPPGLATVFSHPIALVLQNGCFLPTCVYVQSGQRNWYSNTKTFHYDYDERILDIATPNTPCEHNPNWYVNSAYNQLTNEEKQNVPGLAPVTFLSACMPDGSPKILNNLIPGGCEDIGEGTYKIKSAVGSAMYLDVDGNTKGEIVTLNGLGGDDSENIWRLKQVPGLVGGYTIENCFYKGKYLDADILNTGKDGCKVQIWERGISGARTNQEWYVCAVGTTGRYKIQNVQGKIPASGEMMLDAEDDGKPSSRLKLWNSISGEKSQQWFFEQTSAPAYSYEAPNELVALGAEHIPEGVYIIKSKVGNNQYLDVDGSSNGDKVHLDNLGDIDDNKWKVVNIPSVVGGYTIKHVKSGKYLDADYLNTGNDGCKVQIWERSSGDRRNQEWYVKKAGTKSFRIINVKSSNMMLDARDSGTTESRVKLWERIGDDNSQMWYFYKVN